MEVAFGITSWGLRTKILAAIEKFNQIKESHHECSSSASSAPVSSTNDVARSLSYPAAATRPVISEATLSSFFDCQTTPEIRDTQRTVAISTFVVKRVLFGILKSIPSDGQGCSLQFYGSLVKASSEKRLCDKYHRIKLDLSKTDAFHSWFVSEILEKLPPEIRLKDNTVVPIPEVLTKVSLVLKLNSAHFDVETSASSSAYKVNIKPFPIGTSTGDLHDAYEQWNPVQKAFWEANRCQTVRIFCAGGKTLVQIMDALGLTQHPFDQYKKTLICGSSKASVDNVKKYFQTGNRGRWSNFDDSDYDSCSLKRFLSLKYQQYQELMKGSVLFLGDRPVKHNQSLISASIVVASSQRISSQRRQGNLDFGFGHIIIDERDYGFAGPEEGEDKGEWKKIRDNNPAAFITYYSGTTQNAQGCEIPAPYISISYKDLVLAGQVKTMCFYTLFGPKYRNVLPNGLLWNPREVPQLASAEEREEADMCRRKILGPGLYISVCKRDPPKCVIDSYIFRAVTGTADLADAAKPLWNSYTASGIRTAGRSAAGSCDGVWWELCQVKKAEAACGRGCGECG